MRTKKSLTNIIIALTGQAFNFAISIAARSVLARTMPMEYMGINGLFYNLLTVLSLAELGIGSAMLFAFYKPVAEEDILHIQKLLNLYRRMYHIVALVVAVIGICMIPFLGILVKTENPVDHLVGIYLLYLAQMVSSYFFYYKTVVITAHQNQYIIDLYSIFFKFCRYTLQIVVLLLTANFFAYLAVQIICELMPNVLASLHAQKLYPYIKENKHVYPDKEEIHEIFKNVRAMFLGKIGSVFIYSFDSILVSSLIGLTTVGIYSNYRLIANNINQVLSQAINATSASVGNLNALEEADDNRLASTFFAMNLGGFFLYSYCTVAMAILMAPFIRMFFGENYLFPTISMLLILTQFYIDGMRMVINVFRNAKGLFWYDRYKSIIAAFMNLGLSILLSKWFGLNGILAATIVELVLIQLWIDPFVLFKYGFKGSTGRYMARYFVWYAALTAIMIAAGIITNIVTAPISVDNFMMFIVKGLAITAVYGLLMLASLGWTASCRKLFSYVLKFLPFARKR